ncbi:YsnF/AvaK domain-containing protein [Arthrobacter sp. zg-Y895]|uniref:YsnF/AvaK domain-containing protein n=1 Tax=Arthrobacter sp. zg-Y895 TaxID=2886933 RepID=UPI001D13B406|nr:YsnF/AvaK domain-containing protein [Arthrobacter sp. zg-Y895]MCC3300565.1 YsnF/AvaK domain-containing protein [Arthrobacter sp. zg-Y895]
MITNQQVEGLMSGSGNVVGSNGDRIGAVGTFYLDDQTDEPAWVTVNTGLFGTSETFIPLSEATVEGADVLVPYSKEEVKNAPHIESDGSISPDEEVTLYRYYGFSYDDGSSESVSETDTITETRDSGMRGSDMSSGTSTVSGSQTSGTSSSSSSSSGTSGLSSSSSGSGSGDDSMTRSEERLNVGTENRAVGKARLRKYIVTETVTKQVPVSHEEVRIEREPITDANAGDALSGAELTEDEHEVTLHAEEAVVSKHTEPVERVRLDTETVTDTESVSEEVRKEQIDTDVNDSSSRGKKSGGSGSSGSGSDSSGSSGSGSGGSR